MSSAATFVLGKKHRVISRAGKFLLIGFVLSLSLLNPRVRGDGTGYYAYVRSLIVDHNLQFQGDWQNGRAKPFMLVRDGHGFATNAYITRTGHIPNYFPIGPAILWAPFVCATHAAVLVLAHSGRSIAADGHSRPYLVTMAIATAFYGFLGLWISFRLARDYSGETNAVFATTAIWLATSLPVYMYLEPSWSHAHSAFATSLFLWYWHHTSTVSDDVAAAPPRTPSQWLVWGFISALMCEIYFANCVFLLIPAIDVLSDVRKQAHAAISRSDALKKLFSSSFLYGAAFMLAFLPTLLVRRIIFGNPFAAGAYGSRAWHWTSPEFWNVLFSPSRGLFICTPVLILACLGLFFLHQEHPAIGNRLIAVTIAFYALISVYPWWNGVASFGNRFFISLTPIFVVGLAATFEKFTVAWRDRRAALRRIVAVTSLFIIWNLGLVYQWNNGLLPDVGSVQWREVVYNQFRVVPQDLLRSVQSKLTHTVAFRR